ncbi:MAG TPA: DNA-3-methyladenine glycosylase [Myxococcales bacterium]|nr:DNA-3-methyladenine glycosylase [Myxococcales bacterium]
MTSTLQHIAAPSDKLPRSFYDRPALAVARDLLGKVLVLEEGAGRRAGRIVEVEAYVGEYDLACHAARGRTSRTEVLFGPPGHAYVYLIYGMHHCFNVVTMREGRAAAVLVRGVEPVEGLPERSRTDGPGRLCDALGITLRHNRLDLLGERLFILDAPKVPASSVARGPRIGVDYAGEWAGKPYRLWILGHPHVSRGPPTRAPAPAARPSPRNGARGA